MFSADRYVAALRLAAHQHRGQHVLDSDLPYLVHVTSVAAEVIAALPIADVDPDLALPCALLHDTLEDTVTTPAEREHLEQTITTMFGLEVTRGIQALSKNAALPKCDRMADSLRRICDQPRAIWVVKLADRITNLAPPPRSWSADKRRQYRDEAVEIADTLGAASPALDARLRAKIASYG